MSDELSEQERQLESHLQHSAYEPADDAEFDDEHSQQQQFEQQQQYEQYEDQQQQQQQQQHQQYDDSAMGSSFMQLNLNGEALPQPDGAFLSDDDGFSPADAAGSSSSFPVFKTGECVVRARAALTCARCDMGNGHCYIGSSTGELVLFDFNSQREVWRRQIMVQGKPLQITCIDVSSSHTKLAIGGSGGETVIYDLEQFAVSACFTDHKQRVSAVAWVGTDSTQVIYTTAHDGYFLVRDLRGKILHSFITCTCPLSAMQVESPNIVYLGSWDGQVKKLDLERKLVTLVLKANTLKESPIRCFALAPSPVIKKKKGASEELPVYVLIISHGIGELKAWDMRTGKVYVEAYQGCGDVVNALCVWNGKLYAAGDDRSVRIFDVNTGQSLESLSGHENGVTGLCIVGVTPVVTQEMIDAAEAAAATSTRASRAATAKAAREAKENPQQGVGNELLITTGFDCQARGYKVAAIDAAIQLRLLRLDEQKTQAFEAFVAAKKAAKNKGSRKGSAKGKKKKGGSSKKKKDGAAAAAPSKPASQTASKTGSKAGTARGTADPAATAAATATSPDAAAAAKPSSAKPKSAKKKKAAVK